jgi:hypothetical protein
MHFATAAGDGRALRYHFDEFVAEWLPRLALRLSLQPAFEKAARHVERDLLLLYLEQALYVELIDFARFFYRNKHTPGGAPVAAPADLVEVIRQTLDMGGVAITASWRRELRRPLGALRRRLRQTLSTRTAPPVSRAGGGCIAVELVEGVDPTAKCDAFWLAAGTIDPARVLFVLEAANQSLVNVAQSLEAARRLGSRIVAVDPFPSGAVPYWKPGGLPGWSVTLAGELRGAAPGPQRWLQAALSTLAERAGLWEAFYREYGILATQQFSEASTDVVAKRVAMERVGGIEFGKMRSEFFERGSTAFLFQHEVGMVWHRSVAPILRAGRSRSRALVETGYVYDALPGTMRTEAAALRARLTDPELKLVAAVFDNHPHSFSHTSREDLRLFYQGVLALAQRHRALGLVVKSKKPGILSLVPEEAAALRALEAAGRCLILDQPLTSVLPAALAAELALGFPVSTAACEAALAGCRAVMFDPSRANGHAWTAPGLDIVLPDIEAFGRACDQAVSDIRSGRRGMPRERLLEIDPHLDGKAATRAAAFLGAFLSARDADQPKPQALAAATHACESYAFPA